MNPSDKLSHLLNAHADACFMRDSDRALSARGQITGLYADQDRLMQALRAFFQAVERERAARKANRFMEQATGAIEISLRQNELEAVYEAVEAELGK